MPCYCNDIRKIDKDITTLNSMVSKANSISGRNSTQKTTLKTTSGNAGSSAKPANISSLADAITKSQDKMISNTSSMSSRISNELNSLKNKRSTLKTQDKRFHDAQTGG